MSATRKLATITRKLSRLTRTADTEGAHVDADGFLVDAIRLLATEDEQPAVERLIAAYHAVDKWYA